MPGALLTPAQAAALKSFDKPREPGNGMTMEEVMRSTWGIPIKKEIPEVKDQVLEIWHYPPDVSNNSRSIVFDRTGRVLTIVMTE